MSQFDVRSNSSSMGARHGCPRKYFGEYAARISTPGAVISGWLHIEVLEIYKLVNWKKEK